MALSLNKHFNLGTLTYAQVDSNWTDIEQEVNLIGARLPNNNYSATTDPTVNDDVTQGYSVGSYWFNRTTGKLFVLTNANSGAANWVEQSSVAGSFGSGAYADVITSPTDTTAGRLMTVGAGGWLLNQSSPQLPPNDNLDTLRISGLWRFASSTIGKPSEPAGVVLHVIRLGTNNAHSHEQFAFVYAGASEGGLRHRFMLADGSWSVWSLQYGQNNILGTVSQSDGVPTGAILEWGESSTGYFAKYADGKLECWRVIDLGDSLTFPRGLSDFSYPVTFSASHPVINMGAARIGTSNVALSAGITVGFGNTAGVSSTQWRGIAMDDQSGVYSTQNVWLTLYAAGRWY